MKKYAILFLAVLLGVFEYVTTPEGGAQSTPECTPTFNFLSGPTPDFPQNWIQGGPGSVRLRGTAMTELTVISSENVIVTLPTVPSPDTYVFATFVVIDRSQPVDFEIRTVHDEFTGGITPRNVQIQCACTPTLTVTDNATGGLLPGGPDWFTVTGAPGSIIVDPDDTGNGDNGFQSFDLVSASNAVAAVPSFTPTIPTPHTATFVAQDPLAPVDMTFNVASRVHGISIRAQCVLFDNDGDLVPNAQDNCLAIFNPDQADFDLDGIGDACDSATGPPTNRGQCRDGGWALFDTPRTFRNQGDCLRSVAPGGGTRRPYSTPNTGFKAREPAQE